MDREEAIRCFWYFSNVADSGNNVVALTRRDKEAFNMAIEALSTSEIPNKWIPVSERLPELGEKVLCQCRAGIYEVLKLTVNGWYFDIDHCYMESFVTAWMPIPEPYLLEKPTGSNSEEESEDTDGK